MVASTDIKFYVHTNTNAPQLTNNYGGVLSILDACLINGFGSQTASSAVIDGDKVTIDFGNAHNLVLYQVVLIEGANVSELNGEYRIVEITTNTIKYKLDSTLTTTKSTGVITCTLPPLGWEKPFGSVADTGVGGKGAYRSKNTLLSSRPFLRVVDEADASYSTTYAKFAKVGIVESMSDINTMSGVQSPFDSNAVNKNWVATGSGSTAVNGWAKWYYARSSAITNTYDSAVISGGARQWIVVGTTDYFYFFNNISPLDTPKVAYGFGNFKSLIQADTSNTFLGSTLTNSTANSSSNLANATTITSNSPTLCLQRIYSQVATPVVTARLQALLAADSSGYQNNILPSSTIKQTPSTSVFIDDGSLRGELPLIKWLYQITPYSNNTLIKEDDRVFMAITTVSKATATGQMIVRVA